MFFNEMNERLMGEDFGPEDATAFSSRDFLEEKKDGFSGRFGFGESFF